MRILSYLHKPTAQKRIRDGLILGALVAGLVALLWVSGLFAPLRLGLDNIYYVSAPVSDNIVIVAIDDASLQTYGRSPVNWPRTIYADLVNRLSSADARVIVFDILFAESTEHDETFAQAIVDARASEARTRTILPIIGVEQHFSPNVISHSVSYLTTLQPIPPLAEVADYLSFVNAYPDIDGSIRRQLSVVNMGETSAFSLPIATYLAYLRIPSAAVWQLVTIEENNLQLTAERNIPVDASGLWMQYYFGQPSTENTTTFPVYSIVDVSSDSFDIAVFNDKIVLVGLMNATGFVDQYPVPSSTQGNPMAGVEIQAHAIETLLQNVFIHNQAPLSELLTIITLGLFSGVIYAHLRWYWIIPGALSLTLAWFIYAFVLFGYQQILTNLLHPMLVLGLTGIVSIGWQVTVEARHRREAEYLLESIVEAAKQQLSLEKVATSIANDIQRILLPTGYYIWIGDTGDNLFADAVWPSNRYGQWQPIAEQMKTGRKTVITVDTLGLPVFWQETLVGVFALEWAGKKVNKSQIALLEKLSRQMAPIIHNTLLYARLQHQNRLLETILSGLPSQVFILDDKHRISRMNGILKNILGINLEAHQDKSLLTLFNDLGLPEETQQAIATNFELARPFQQEIRLRAETFIMGAAPISQHHQWVLILNQVTALTELSMLKTRMIRMASHDIKNPLSRILAYTHLAQDASRRSAPLEINGEKFIDHIQEGAEDILRIITSILNLERARSADNRHVPVDLRQIITRAIAQNRVELQRKNQLLQTQVLQEPLVVMGDSDQLIQAVTNLLDNAIKYTAENGTVQIRLKLNSGKVRLEIEDNGYGIPLESQPKLFSEFYRVRNRATAHLSGTGLGLSLVKSVVEFHGGKVGFQSVEGRGSTFFIELTLESNAQIQNSTPAVKSS